MLQACHIKCPEFPSFLLNLYSELESKDMIPSTFVKEIY